MIIRSQDKCKIIPLNQPVYIEMVSGKWNVSTERYFLGKYSTEEKAIKVLDMIMEHYDKVIDAKYWNDEYQENYFIMPSDEEVEV